jgi:hypothetical protein
LFSFSGVLWSTGGDSHLQPGDVGVMKLESWEAEDHFVYGCDDEKGKAFLVHGFHSEGEWCCDM